MKTLMVVSVMSLTGCFLGSSPYPNQYGSVVLMGDAQGMRAFTDGLNALVTNGKALPGRPSQAWGFRVIEEQQRTLRTQSGANGVSLTSFFEPAAAVQEATK